MTSLSSHKIASLMGEVQIPGDKSISHRALMLGAIATGSTEITGLLMGEDVIATAMALIQVGVDIDLKPEKTVVQGVGLNGFQSPYQDLDMGNSGTSTRLLMGLMAGCDVKAKFIGDHSLSKRPMRRVMDPLSHMGAIFHSDHDMKLPITLQGSSQLTPITYEQPIASAQVKSAILLAGLGIPDQKTVVIEPAPSRDHTENMLAFFGADIHVEGPKITVSGRQVLSGQKIDVPGDPSSAAFLTVAALITPKSDLYLPNICMNPRRDGLYQTLVEMGADITFENTRKVMGERIVDLRVRSSALTGVNVPAERAPTMIDEYPILFVAASCATGQTFMPGLKELRVKESDRLAIMAKGLQDAGVNLEIQNDHDLTIYGSGKNPIGGALVQTHLDHRIAMSFLVLGLVTDRPVTIDDASPIQTSFPDFIPILQNLGVDLRA